MNRSRGFGLVEALIAALLLAIGISGLVLAQRRSVSEHSDAWRQTAAMFAAQSCIDLRRVGQTCSDATLLDPGSSLTGLQVADTTVGGVPQLRITYSSPDGNANRIVPAP